MHSLNSRQATRIRERVPAVVWLPSFVIQFVAATAFILWASDWLGDGLRTLAQPYRFLDGPVRLMQTLMPDFAGFLTGFLLRSLPAIFREPGRWIWIVPTGLSAALLAGSVFTNMDHMWISVLGWRGQAYQGAGIVGLVFPLGGVFLYSMGIRSGDRYTDPLAGAEENYD